MGIYNSSRRTSQPLCACSGAAMKRYGCIALMASGVSCTTTSNAPIGEWRAQTIVRQKVCVENTDPACSAPYTINHARTGATVFRRKNTFWDLLAAQPRIAVMKRFPYLPWKAAWNTARQRQQCVRPAPNRKHRRRRQRLRCYVSAHRHGLPWPH